MIFEYIQIDALFKSFYEFSVLFRQSWVSTAKFKVTGILNKRGIMYEGIAFTHKYYRFALIFTRIDVTTLWVLM